MWGSYYHIPRVIFYLLKGDYRVQGCFSEGDLSLSHPNPKIRTENYRHMTVIGLQGFLFWEVGVAKIPLLALRGRMASSQSNMEPQAWSQKGCCRF